MTTPTGEPTPQGNCRPHGFMGIAFILPWCSFCGHMLNAECHQ